VPSKEKRDARLDKLKTAAEAWADKETERLNKEVELLTKITKGRPGADRLQNSSIEAASDLLVDELNSFLSGEDLT
jgi:hypothetical protein